MKANHLAVKIKSSQSQDMTQLIKLKKVKSRFEESIMLSRTYIKLKNSSPHIITQNMLPSTIPSQQENHMDNSLLYRHFAFHKCHTLHSNPQNVFPYTKSKQKMELNFFYFSVFQIKKNLNTKSLIVKLPWCFIIRCRKKL
jgi:hypothetical protein